MAPWPRARLAALGPEARGRRAGSGRGAQLGAPHLPGTRARAARLGTKNKTKNSKIAFIVGILMLELLVADGGPGSRGVSPGETAARLGLGPGGDRAAPSPRRGRTAGAGHGDADARGCGRGAAAARTSSSKSPRDHPPGRPGPPGGRPAPPRRPDRRRAPLCDVNFSGTNCLLIVWERSGLLPFFFSSSVFISAWPPAMPWAASPPSSFPFISISQRKCKSPPRGLFKKLNEQQF